MCVCVYTYMCVCACVCVGPCILLHVKIILLCFQFDVVLDSRPFDVSMFNSNINLSQHKIEETVDLTCVVQSCRTMNYFVELVGPRNKTLKSWQGVYRKGENAFTWSIPVDIENVGSYRCTTMAVLNNNTFMAAALAGVSGMLLYVCEVTQYLFKSVTVI